MAWDGNSDFPNVRGSVTGDKYRLGLWKEQGRLDLRQLKKDIDTQEQGGWHLPETTFPYSPQ